MRPHLRGETLLDDLQIVLGELCRTGGFCSALADDILIDGAPLTADGFATAVLAAEGWPDPERDLEWRPAFKRFFVERYGDSISAADYPNRCR